MAVCRRFSVQDVLVAVLLPVGRFPGKFKFHRYHNVRVFFPVADMSISKKTGARYKNFP
jgi:hypothetical protein